MIAGFDKHIHTGCFTRIEHPTGRSHYLIRLGNRRRRQYLGHTRLQVLIRQRLGNRNGQVGIGMQVKKLYLVCDIGQQS